MPSKQRSHDQHAREPANGPDDCPVRVVLERLSDDGAACEGHPSEGVESDSRHEGRDGPREKNKGQRHKDTSPLAAQER